MKTVAIVQARMGSTRLPGKVLRDLSGHPLIEVLLTRLARATRVDEIVLATSTDPRNDPLVDCVTALGYSCFRGSETDVLSRYLLAAEGAGADTVIRITGDCPLVDPAVVDLVVEAFLREGVEYCSNVATRSFPDGLDTEVFSLAALRRSAEETDADFDHEHVTPYLRTSGRFTTAEVVNPVDCSNLRLTVDETADLRVMQSVFAHFAPDIHFGWERVVALAEADPAMFAANANIPRNEGSQLTNGQKLWKRAKEIIPGGNMLLSKRSEMFLPDQWPSYFSRTKGCSVWDLDGTEYRDMSLMGVGTNTLGYSHPEVDAAVMTTVQAGNMSTLNCPEEVALAEKLIELHPWAEMVRLARSGGEANAIAVRIARAASGRDEIAICGYHGWHDWYLATNLGNERGLDGHLLPGLDPNGVPRALLGTVHPFEYNNLEQLKALVDQHPIGVIKMEVSRNAGPAPGFLEAIRALATEKGIVLVFDECTSGFRETYGGLHLKYGVEPDVAIFGKALGNGYGITAVIGRREVMDAAQTSFISSTFWTERIGPSAAVKTLEVMARVQSWDAITAIGHKVRAGWQATADAHGLEIGIAGLPSLSTYAFKAKTALEYKTLVTQEMLAKGWLASTNCYASMAHTDDVIADYFADLDGVFALIAECEHGDRKVADLLKGPVCHAGFKRLN
ncbi:MAG: aminotransferase class III-fold pyridoxal phosphate-dependent enzyme [Rhodobacteraceae bacterium]|nr:aminotransferase class III-fold pyridoxal phosphate-dependent enzyme [Paracoccaceae bacterium]